MPVNLNPTDPNLTPLASASPSGLVQAILNGLLIVAALVFVLYLLWGGYKWITSGGDKEGISKASRTISHALIGLIIVFSVFAGVRIFSGFTGINLLCVEIPALDVSLGSCAKTQANTGGGTSTLPPLPTGNGGTVVPPGSICICRSIAGLGNCTGKTEADCKADIQCDCDYATPTPTTSPSYYCSCVGAPSCTLLTETACLSKSPTCTCNWIVPTLPPGVFWTFIFDNVCANGKPVPDTHPYGGSFELAFKYSNPPSSGIMSGSPGTYYEIQDFPTSSTGFYFTELDWRVKSDGSSTFYYPKFVGALPPNSTLTTTSMSSGPQQVLYLYQIPGYQPITPRGTYTLKFEFPDSYCP